MEEQSKIDVLRVYTRFYKSREKYYTPKINKELKKQVQYVIDNGLSQTSLTSIPSYPMLVLLKELYTDAATVYGAKVYASLPKSKARMPIGFSQMMQDLLDQYFRLELLNTVAEIEQTTRTKIQEIFSEASINGFGNDWIIAQLQLENFTRIRARLIARTETATSANQGAMFAAQTTGVALRKVWISAKDNRTRRRPRNEYDHLHMDGVTIPFNDSFDVSGEKMKQPGDRKNGATAGNICNCRCTIGFKK